MAKTYKLTAGDVPERHTTSVYVDIVADFIAQGTDSDSEGHQSWDQGVHDLHRCQSCIPIPRFGESGSLSSGPRFSPGLNTRAGEGGRPVGGVQGRSVKQPGKKANLGQL